MNVKSDKDDYKYTDRSIRRSQARGRAEGEMPSMMFGGEARGRTKKKEKTHQTSHHTCDSLWSRGGRTVIFENDA